MNFVQIKFNFALILLDRLLDDGERRCTRQLRAAGSNTGPPVGAEVYPTLRWRSERRDHLR